MASPNLPPTDLARQTRRPGIATGHPAGRCPSPAHTQNPFVPAPDRKAPGSLFLPLGDKPVASTSTAIAMRKGDPDMLNYLNTVLGFHRGSGWLGERVRYWSEQMTKAR